MWDRIVHMTHPERRKLARLPLEILVRIRVQGSDQVDFAETRNVSARGIYFHTNAQLKIGQDLECVLVLLEKLTRASSPMLIGCRAKVLRLNRNQSTEIIGVAVEVYSYDFSWQETS